MKFQCFIFLCLIYLSSFAQIPDGFVNVKNVIPDLDVELRYFGTNNFVGKPIDGYFKEKLFLTKPSAEALRLVQVELQKSNLCLKVYDGYRPQRAVDHFVKWAKDFKDTINKSSYYPHIAKQDLFKYGYIAYKSGHSRGSTVDVTIIDCKTGKPLDMGSTYDFFGKQSAVDYGGISKKQKRNRKLLQKVMLKYGFRGYRSEWWHFTLKNEPFPNTYFDFLVK